ncbi:hypothetical protein BDV06DRAFT_225351 [Aspergillus oleicola]
MGGSDLKNSPSPVEGHKIIPLREGWPTADYYHWECLTFHTVSSVPFASETVTVAGQYPIGFTQPPEPRAAIYKIASEHGLIIIEVNSYYFLSLGPHRQVSTNTPEEEEKFAEVYPEAVPANSVLSYLSIDTNGLGYLDRLNKRIPVMKANPQWTIGVNEISALATLELFKEVMVEHTFDIEHASKDPAQALRTLCRNIKNDFYLMCPDGQGNWRLQGYISCVPGGLMGRDVNKFVRRIKVDGQLVQRFNVLEPPVDGNNYYTEKGRTLPEESQRINIYQCWLCYKRKTLNVLPKTKGIVFCVRLYMTSLWDIVREGNGVELADAIDSMPEKLCHYKKRLFWARDVMVFLRKGD